MASDLQAERDLEFADPEDFDLGQQMLLEQTQQHELPEQAEADFADQFPDQGADGAPALADAVDEDDYGAPPPLTGTDPGEQPPDLADGHTTDDQLGTAGVTDGQPSTQQPQRPAPPTSRQNRQDIHAGEPQETPESAPPGDTGFDDGLVRRAMQYGMSEQQARGYSSPQDLESTLQLLDQQALHEGMRRRQAELEYQQWLAQYGQQQQAQQQPAQQAAPQQTNGQQEPRTVDKFQFDEELVDAGTAELLNGMQDHYQQAFSQQQAQLDALTNRLQFAEQATQHAEQQRQQEEAQRYFHDFDAAVSELGEDFADVLGQGPTSELPPQSVQYANRYRLQQAEWIMREQHGMNGRSVPIKDAVKSSAANLFPTNQQNSVRNQVRGDLRQRQQQMVARPTRRAASPASSLQQAGAKWDRWAQHQGLYPGAAAEDIADGV